MANPTCDVKITVNEMKNESKTADKIIQVKHFTNNREMKDMIFRQSSTKGDKLIFLTDH